MLLLLLLLFLQPPVCEVCPHHEVAMFQPRTGNSPDLDSVTYCYVYFLVPPFLFISPPYVRLRRKPTPAPPIIPLHVAQSVPA